MITRRDFLNGASMAVAASLCPAAGAAALETGRSDARNAGALGDYPPALLGLRGNHEGSQVSPHALRDGTIDIDDSRVRQTHESYDLIVVGAGISGLSAAYFYRKMHGRQSRVLILDNHDDFGGHARRNEFEASGRTLLSYGGAQAIDNPDEYRPVAMDLLRELGVSVTKLRKHYDAAVYRGLGAGYFFDSQTFGADRLVTGLGSRNWGEFLAESPLPNDVKSTIHRLYTDKRDYLAAVGSVEKKRQLLREISYAEYLKQYCGADDAALKFFQTFPHDLFGVGIESVSALACYENPDDYDAFTYPALDHLGFEPLEREPYQYMFPDGNSSIARLVVRSLIPSAVPGSSADDIVNSRTHYDRLDVSGESVKIRLRSPALKVTPLASGSAEAVQVDYARGGAVERVTSKHCVLACNNGMIPYLCPGLPEKQKTALHYGAKVPFLYTHVALKNWHAFARLGIRHIVSPGSYHSYTSLAFPVSATGYECSRNPDSPNVLFMLRAPCAPGLPRRNQHRAGRAELVATSFATIENNIRDQLQRMLGRGGFDHERDIAGITVNRWAHGYAYEYDSLSDPSWAPGAAPHEVGRQPYGPITIANSDSAAAAYTDAAIDMGHRAVLELGRITQG